MMPFWRRTKPTPDPKFDLSGSLANWILQSLKLVGAKTYVEITATHPAEGELTYTVMRLSGESHGARAERYEKIILGQQTRIADLEHQLHALRRSYTTEET